MGRDEYRQAPRRRPDDRSAGGSRTVTILLLVAIMATGSALGWANRTRLGAFADQVIHPGRASANTTGPDASPRPLADTPGVSTAEQAAPPLINVSAPVSVPVNGFMSWAVLDVKTGTIHGSPNMAGATNSTESMIKAWIASDYLRRQGTAKPAQATLDEISTMIRDSDDGAAEDIYQAGGGNAVVQRMISTCGLTRTSIFDGWWSRTQISAQDAVRMGGCIASGRAAGPTWTPWLLGEMRQVRGEGRFGIIDALPADAVARTAIKNGWTQIGEDSSWHVNCLAIIDQYVVSVLTRYPTGLGLDYGANVCQQVATQLQPRG
jgi:hypothetical protein